jgi:hypothetical protein
VPASVTDKECINSKDKEGSPENDGNAERELLLEL